MHEKWFLDIVTIYLNLVRCSVTFLHLRIVSNSVLYQEQLVALKNIYRRLSYWETHVNVLQRVGGPLEGVSDSMIYGFLAIGLYIFIDCLGLANRIGKETHCSCHEYSKTNRIWRSLWHRLLFNWFSACWEVKVLLHPTCKARIFSLLKKTPTSFVALSRDSHTQLLLFPVFPWRQWSGGDGCPTDLKDILREINDTMSLTIEFM